MIVAALGPALAICPVCNASVRFDDRLALCFAEWLQKMPVAASSQSFVIVNLGDCDIRRTLPIVPDPKAKPPPLDSLFITDTKGLECLRGAIASSKAKLDPGYEFDLAKLCP